MKTFGQCPHCKASMDDPAHPGYGVVIGVEVQHLYDGILFWQCPYCHKRWHRWPEGTRQHGIACEFVPPPATEIDAKGAA